MDINAICMGISLTCALFSASRGDAWWALMHMAAFAANMFLVLKG